MENVNCLLCNFPWDLFLFLFVLGLLLWWLLSRFMSRKYQARIDDLNDDIALLKSENEDREADDKSLIALLESELERCRDNENAALGTTASGFAGEKDDLKVIEGIGPRIEELLNDAGIYTFARLAETSVKRLQGTLDVGGPGFQIHDPSTWPRQAALARDGKWDDLKEWQDILKGGREG